MKIRKKNDCVKKLIASALIFSVIALGLSTPVLAEDEVVGKRFDWMPAESVSENSRGEDIGGEQIIPEITVTKTPKATADIAKFTREYVIDLKKFGISNECKNPAETSKGINQALQDAKAAGANRIVFPKGTYLISETDPVVLDHKDTIIDLNGATLQINTNGLPKYGVVDIVQGAGNLRLTNGTLRGDRDTHDYKTEKGTHEWGQGIRFISGRNLEIDHILSCNMTGDGVASSTSGTRTRPELLATIFYSIYAKEFEQGAFSGKGEKTDSKEKMRSIKPYDVTKCEGEFEFGYLSGYLGYPFIKGRVYQAYFYGPDMKFVEKKKCLQFRKVQIPEGAKFLHLEINQPEIPDEPAHAGAAKGSWIARITNFKPSTDVHFHHNQLSQNRRLGMAFCGGQKWVVEDNLFDGNKGTNPGYGVDFEDGAELVQDVVFRNNKFKDNAGDLVVCAGSELLFEGNEIEKNVVFWGRTHNYTFRKNKITGGLVSYTTRTGVAKIQDNSYENCTMSITFDTKAVADGLVRKAGQTVSTPPLKLENESLVNMKRVTGTYLNFVNSKMTNVNFTADKDTRLINFMNCEFTDTSLEYAKDGPDVNVTIKNCKGELKESGPGMESRKKIR
ncbi:MAG TPA: hypothetical protein DET40_07075 [Lentisphaeria bacterium]|nr:MAG: hypothetical protein A2X45_07225 [Lentisphaerae bacterium GWF2_50_93]HCE43293.1 hypothetical protein [Lentisphaeria bacterium]